MDIKQVPHNGKWSSQLGDGWIAFCKAAIEYAKRHDFKYLIKVGDEEGNGDGFTIFAESASGNPDWELWDSEVWSEYVDVLKLMPSGYPDGDLQFANSMVEKGQPLLNFWHD